MKIGDKVKLNPNCRGFTFGKEPAQYGDVGVIRETSDNIFLVEFPNINKWKGLKGELILYNKILEEFKINQDI